MRHQNGQTVDEGVSPLLGIRFFRLFNPDRGQAIRRIAGLNPAHGLGHAGGMDSKPAVRHGLPFTYRNSVNQDLVIVRSQARAGAEADHRQHQTHFLYVLIAKHGDPIRKTAVIDHRRQQMRASLDLDGFDLQGLVGISRGRRRGQRIRTVRGLGGLRPGTRCPSGDPPQAQHRHGKHKCRQRRDARQCHQCEQRGAHEKQCLGEQCDLAGDFLTEISVRCRSRNDDAGCHGNDQRRHLRHDAIANRQQGIDANRLAPGNPELHHADHQASNDVDGHNQDAGNGVALDEF
ncbi:hypothetical protein D3C85_564690 [compost metagenome]